MLRNLFAAAVLVAAPVPASAPDAPSPSPIPLVVCVNSHGVYMGSAFRVGQSLLLSVKHVTNMPVCYIGGHKVRVLYTAPNQDFSMITDDTRGPTLPIDCDGFVKGRRYIAVGHARGVEELVPVALTATGQSNDDGMAVLTGIFTAQPGHSGGPILDAETKKVVGTVNAANWESGFTFSVELKNTPVCIRAAATMAPAGRPIALTPSP